MSKWKIEPHDGMDKHFLIDGPLSFEIDYDDVPHDQVDILADAVVACLNRHFVAPLVWRCKDPDEDLEVLRPGAIHSWDTMGCWDVNLREQGLPCPVCEGPTEPVEASL